jgi:hypothetical protein
MSSFLLDSDDVRFYGTGSADGAGFALYRSGGVVGVSNVFAGSAELITVWSDLVVVAARTNLGFDLVGYELGADRQAALAVGRWLRRHRTASGLDALNGFA